MLCRTNREAERGREMSWLRSGFRASSKTTGGLNAFLFLTITHHLLHPSYPISPSFPLSLLFVYSIYLFPHHLSCLLFSLLLCQCLCLSTALFIFLLIHLILALFFHTVSASVSVVIFLKEGCTKFWGRLR